MLAIASSGAWAGISETKHNLGSSNNRADENHVTSGTAEICVFCHTPHGANLDVEAPLWNKALPGSTYTVYSSTNSTTIDGATATEVGSVSLACLSCHDGTQAMDNIINAPGSGGFDPTGGGSNGLDYTWTGPRVTATGRLQNSVALLGTDLTNDHPIGIQYAGGGYDSGTPTPGAGNDPDFVAASNATINNVAVWWVDTTGVGGSAGTREKTDMILYTRASGDFGGGATVEPSVECASCHDPHTNDNATFLRVTNDGSKVCLSCHTK